MAQFDAPIGTGKALAHAPTSLVFMFPGQGCQYTGMGNALYENYPPFKAALERCWQVYQAAYGADLRAIMFHADQAAALRQTQYVQPALFALEYALASLLISWGLQPSAVIGHSLGEYVAATVAGVLSLKDAVHLVGLRGQLMQTLPPGNMLACFAPAERVQSLMPLGCDLAAVNSPSQCVVAGPPGPINCLRQTLNQQAMTYRLLDSDKAFHSASTEAIYQDFLNGLSNVTFSPPEIDYVSNLSGDYMTAAPAADYWAQQMRHCVAFHQGLLTLLQQPDHGFIEVGPGNTLTALVKQHAQGNTPRACTALLPSHPGKEGEINCLHRGLGRLWQQGYTLDWRSWQGNGHTLPLPGYALGGKTYFVEANGQSPSEAVTTEELQRVDDRVAVMKQIWQQHLGYDAIEPDRDFYELGGDSLLAINLIAHINRALGSKLYAHDLLQAPTIERLDRLLGQHDRERPFCLVTLNQGEDTRIPLFFMHAVGGSVQYFRDLTMHLAESQPVYGLQAQGLDGTTDPHISLVDMAHHYLSIIRAVRARGPYRLGGHSFGGLLAYEIATQLHRQGEIVDLLCLIDTPGFDQMPVRVSDDVDILYSMAILFDDDSARGALDRLTLQRLSGEARLAYFLTQVENLYLKQMSCDDLALLLKLFKANSDAMFDYRPTPQPELSITFFKAQIRDAITADHPEQGWQVHVGKERVEVHLVPGTHHTMMENPHVKVIADIINQKIIALSARSGGNLPCQSN
jgi:thioesterase domain-containing protein